MLSLSMYDYLVVIINIIKIILTIFKCLTMQLIGRALSGLTDKASDFGLGITGSSPVSVDAGSNPVMVNSFYPHFLFIVVCRVTMASLYMNIGCYQAL